jgi:hypothetical protein
MTHQRLASTDLATLFTRQREQSGRAGRTREGTAGRIPTGLDKLVRSGYFYGDCQIVSDMLQLPSPNGSFSCVWYEGARKDP